MRGNGRIFKRPNSTVWWIAYCHRGKENRESAANAIKEAGRNKRRKMTDEDARKVAEKLLKHRLCEIGADRLGLRAFVGPIQDRLRVADLLDALEADFRVRGLKSLAKTIGHLRIVRAALGDLRAVAVSDETVNSYIERQLGEGRSPATVNRRTTLLGQAFRLAVRRRQISSMPEVPKLREDNARQGFFAKNDFLAVLSNLGDQDIADFLEWFYWTGMRPGEIRSLTWACFDRETWTLRLHAKDAKTGHGRVIPLEDCLQEIIKRRITARRFGCDLIFHKKGAGIGTFYKRWNRACRLAGVAGKIPHDLRRTAVRNFLRAGVPEKVAMSISGHRTRAVFDRYNIVSERDIAEAISKTTAYVKSLTDSQSVTPIKRQAASVSVK